jgi:hypothetical protein
MGSKIGLKPPKATPRLPQSQVHGKYKPGAWEVKAKYMRGTCEVRAWYKPGTSRVEARGFGGGFEGKARLK